MRSTARSAAARAPTLRAIELRSFERLRALVREHAQELTLLFGERASLGEAERHHADRCPVGVERDERDRLVIRRRMLRRELGRRGGGLGGRVVDLADVAKRRRARQLARDGDVAVGRLEPLRVSHRRLQSEAEPVGRQSTNEAAARSGRGSTFAYEDLCDRCGSHCTRQSRGHALQPGDAGSADLLARLARAGARGHGHEADRLALLVPEARQVEGDPGLFEQCVRLADDLVGGTAVELFGTDAPTLDGAVERHSEDGGHRAPISSASA